MFFKSSIWISIILIMITVGAWSTNADTKALPNGSQDFTLINNTGVIIDSVYISPTYINSWQEDILGQDRLADGDSVNIHFNRQERTTKWDIRVEDSDGNALIWEDINLLAISKVTLYYNNGKGTAALE